MDQIESDLILDIGSTTRSLSTSLSSTKLYKENMICEHVFLGKASLIGKPEFAKKK